MADPTGKSSYKLAIIPGDGVGMEVTREALKVGEKAMKMCGASFECEWFDWGCDYYLKNGEMMPKNALDILSGFDAIYLGCVGDAAKVPDHISLTLLLAIRKGFDQGVNLRPIYLYEGVETPIRTAVPGKVDLAVVRENTEGEYSQVGGRFKQNTKDEVVLQTAVFTRKGTERVMRYAFELALKRGKFKGEDDKYVGMVTNCSKSNALNYSMVFWDDVYKEVASDYPNVKSDFAMVDAITMWFVKNPDYFDVIVASNLFGDIITDLGAMLQGGMGFAAGGNINPDGTYPSMFEPIHGSAPKYTGKGIVNPVASIEAIRMLIEHVGEDKAAAKILSAVKAILKEGKVKTKDMGGRYSTAEMGDAIATELP